LREIRLIEIVTLELPKDYLVNGTGVESFFCVCSSSNTKEVGSITSPLLFKMLPFLAANRIGKHFGLTAVKYGEID
jgi:hypothetical protein